MSIVWLTISQAAELAGVDISTLRRWADTGRIPAIRTPGGHRRFRTSDVAALATPVALGEPVARTTKPQAPNVNPLDHEPELALALSILLDPTVEAGERLRLRGAIRRAVYEVRRDVGRVA